MARWRGYVAFLGLVAGCGGNGGTRVLVSVSANDRVERYDLFVRDDATREILLHSGWSDATAGGKRDLVGAPLGLGLTFPAEGKYSLALVGAIGATSATPPYIAPEGRQFYWAQTITVGNSNPSLMAKLLEVPRPDDTDGDLFPDAAAWVGHQPDAKAIPVDLLDCQDGNDTINPFARERCGNGLDDDCNGMDDVCLDADGDGDPDSTDCKPNDPTIHRPTAKDPAPESANCCGYSLGKMGPDAHKSFDQDPACHASTCGDGIDQDCDGADRACERDRDCDGFTASAQQQNACSAPANMPAGNDCDDCDPLVNIQAAETCDGKDNNCNGAVDETCVSCDLDGDGYQRMDAKNKCPDAKTDQHPGMIDCNDEDAGVFPGSTMVPVAVPSQNKATCGGVEGGTVACALRGACQRRNPDGSKQDADCDGTAWKGCPAMNDADGDGFPTPADCDDNDPKIFPSAPDRCGDGIAQNCIQDSPCGTDADGDGYDSGNDCNDNDPLIHPWATELCNGKDDDCDGLVDEGNPDSTGAPLTKNGATTACSASNQGACAMPLGRCVCSGASLSGLLFDQVNRAACPGENADIDTGPRASDHAPRCYFSAQPSPELCDGIDNDCTTTTADGNIECPGPKNAGPICCTAKCVDTQTDVANCNGCGMMCMVPPHATPKCTMGMCGIGGCQMPWADCNAMPGDGCEVDTATDVANCGQCKNACKPPPNAATATCALGVCGLGTCNAGFTDCNKVLADGCEINTATDTNNCGMCGKVCSVMNGMASCAAGSCAIGSCSPPFADCNMSGADGCEVNVSNDPNNCSACGSKCALAHAVAGCAVSACTVASCMPGWGNCDNMAPNGCERDLTTDKNSCGMCGKVCGAVANGTEGCTNGSCVIASCNAGFTDCNLMVNDGCEVQTATSTSNCGMCGKVCSFPNASPKCTAGACGILTCNGMFKDCNMMANDGCEIDGATDKNNCGMCGKVCGAVANASPGCTAGVCGIAMCLAGFGDCDVNAGNGCEKSLATDVNNCGMCGNVCNNGVDGKLCTLGVCGCVALGDCQGGGSADACRNAKCACGMGAACDTSSRVCVGGSCLLKGGQPCNNSNECASNNCHGNPLKC